MPANVIVIIKISQTLTDLSYIIIVFYQVYEVLSIMDLQHLLLVFVVVIPQVILWVLVVVALVYKFLSRNQEVSSIVDEEAPEEELELEEPPYTPFGGRADRVHVNYKEEVFSVSRTLGASRFAMDDVLALSTTRIRSALQGALGTTTSRNGCSMLEDVLAMRTIDEGGSTTCILMTSAKEESLSSLDNTENSEEDTFGSDVNNSYPESVFHGSSSRSSSPQSPPTNEGPSTSRARMTSTPRCPQQLLKEALITARPGTHSVRKVLLPENTPSVIEASGAMPSVIEMPNIPYSNECISNQCSMDDMCALELLPTSSFNRNSFKYSSTNTSSRVRMSLLKDALLQVGLTQTTPVHTSLIKSSSTYHKFDDCDVEPELDITEKPQFLRVQRF